MIPSSASRFGPGFSPSAEHAAERGELEPDVDLDFLVELFFAALWYRLLAANGPLDRRFADDLTDALLTLAG